MADTFAGAPLTLDGVPPAPGRARIAANTFWSGIESIVALLVSILSSLMLARAFGPAKMGDYSLIVWFTSLSGAMASLCIPMATRKYMAEHLGRNERGVARAVFFATLLVQTLLALAIASIGIAAACKLVQPGYRIVAAVLFASIVPQMVTQIPSQANNAVECFAANVPGSVAGMLVFLCGVVLSLTLGWDLLGVALGTFLSHVTEAAIKLTAVLRWTRAMPKATLPAHLRKRMLGFSKLNVALSALTLIVWERSDVLLLKLLHPDVRQIAFFSVSFNLVEKALILPRSLAGAMSARLLVEYGRSLQRTLGITELAFKYLAVCGLPMLAGLAAISTPLFAVFYGPAYTGAGNVLMLIALLAIAKCMMGPAQTLWLATENMGLLLWTALASGVANLLFDLILIPRYGALGAATGNGLGQALAAFLLWRHAVRVFKLKLDSRFVRKILLCIAAMIAVVLPLVLFLNPALALAAGVAAGVIAFLLMARFTSLASAQDRSHLLRLSSSAPGMRHAGFWFVGFLTGRKAIAFDPAEVIS